MIERENGNRGKDNWDGNPAVDTELVKLLVQISDPLKPIRVSEVLSDLNSTLLDAQMTPRLNR